MRRYLCTTAALTTLLFACGKSEPEPAPQPAVTTTEAAKPAPADPAKTGTEAAKQEEKPGGMGAAPATPPPTEPAPSLAALLASPPPGERAALQPASIANVPADIVAVGGTPSLQALVLAFTAQAKNVPGAEVPADPVAVAIAAVKAQLGIDLGWLDVDKPLRFAVPDPKKYADGFVLLLPEKTALDPATVPGATPGNGHFLTVKIEDREVFLDRVVDGHLLVTSHGDLAKSLDTFAKDLGAWTPKDPLVIDTSVENLVRIFGEELKSAKEMVGAMGGAMGDDPEMGGQMAQMLKMAAGGFALVEGTSRMSLALDPSGDFPRIGLAFRGLDGSPLAAIAKDLAGRSVAFAGAVPGDAWLALGFDIQGASYLSDAKGIVDAITKGGLGPMPITWSDDEKQAMLALLEKAQTLSGSQNMAWLRQEGARAFIFESLSDSKDGAALHKTMVELGDLFYKKIWNEGRKAMLAQGASETDMPAQISFKDFVALASKNLGAMGFGLAVNESSTKAGSTAGALEVSIDWSRLPMRGEAKAIGDIIGPNVGIALAGEGERFASVIGPEAAARASRILDQAAAPPEATDPWLAMAKGHALFAMLRPARLMRALVDIVPDLAEKRAEISAMSDDPFVLRGSSDGQSVYLEATIPVKVLTALATLR